MLNASATSGVRIGTSSNFATPAAGTISITAGRDIALNGDAHAAAIRTTGDVTLSAGGSITEGASGLILAGSLATSSGGGTSLGGPNQVDRFTASAGGDVLLNNSSPVLSLGAMSLPGALTVTQTGALSLTNSISALSQSHSASGDITVGGADATASTALSASGAMAISAGGGIVLRASDSTSGASAIVSGGTVNMSTGGDLRLVGGAAANSQALVLGGSTIGLTVGGTLRLDGNSDTGAWARVQTATTSGTINVYFPNLSSGGYFVDGFQRLKHGEDGFYTGDKPAKLGETIFVNYGLSAGTSRR
jgi:hypothetical protein